MRFRSWQVQHGGYLRPETAAVRSINEPYQILQLTLLSGLFQRLKSDLDCTGLFLAGPVLGGDPFLGGEIHSFQHNFETYDGY